MTFFFDNNLSQKIVDGFRCFGEDVTHLKEHFPEDVEDEQWLPFVGEREWTAITRDDRVRRRPLQLAKIREYDVGLYVLAGKNLSAWQLIQQLVRLWPRIKEGAEKAKRPFVFRLPPHGTQIDKISV